MSTYMTETSDKSRKKAMRYLLMGGLGFHLFYVGRIKAGVIRFLLASFCWIGVLTGIRMLFWLGNLPNNTNPFTILFGYLALLVIMNVPDAIRLRIGSFRDNVGAPLREN